MIKTCQNSLCGKEFEPEPRLEKRQKYCHKCAQLPVKDRRRTEPIQDKVCQRESCGKTFTPRPNILARQNYCCTYCQQEHRREKSKKSNARNVRNALPMVKAFCPKCERIFKMAMIWNGNKMPRKFCPTCDGFRKSEAFSGLMFDHVFQSSF